MWKSINPLNHCILCLVLFTFSSPSFSEYRWLDPAYLEEAFYEVALKNEYDAGGQNVRKWREPVKIYLEHKVPDEDIHTELAQMHIKHLSYLTNHPIEIVPTPEEANVIWVYTRLSEWEEDIERVLGRPSLQHSKRAICIANFETAPDGQMIKGGIIIPVDQARSKGKLLGCVVEEITQLLGLPNDSEKVYPSIFNDESPEDLLSPLDGLLLKILYHPSLEPGMSKDEAQPIVRAILSEFQQNGTLEGAIREIRKGELYPLMGF
ncbi:conserved hypothetical protein [Vibrio nigripulchritudo MADA3029]|uniref:DUF2927 domain-containing protein n=1 Tax=Vibrio nigripulchritudo TaxID=28173 RepID=UPI0003B22A75|nr:DUF2927 domain-containing protein [Vibrio nigripulchritudo]CCN45642.1 conserved hypothetical protein [Vibrio nigripulchritudo MADA3020]CCN53015.1 conserved hypothetical protein [Vibrio nigripulchritudo MADA3021]CCN61549.1 conserved hypothetical protein [Vibrio nigripulchritudo MADA3029]